MEKVLFIDSGSSPHAAFEKFFESHDLKLVSAREGESGLRLAESESPDLILLDIVLPGKNGLEILKEIRANPRLTKTPIIILTNLEEIHSQKEALRLGVSDYLIKVNYSLGDIVEKIKTVLNKTV